MKYIRKRRFFPRYRTPAGKRGRVKKLTLVFLLLLLIWGLLSEWGLSSLSPELTEEAARGFVRAQVNRAVTEALSGAGEGSFVSLQTNGDGEVASLSTDAAALNGLKSQVLAALEKSINGKATAWVPIGSLTDVGVLTGRGPCVPVKLKLEGSADVSFSSNFSTAGINQSCHRVAMTVTVRAVSQSKRFSVSIQEDTSTVLAETLLVGEAPEIVWTGAQVPET